MKKVHLFIVILFVCIGSAMFSQDIIILKDQGKQIKAKIIEIGTTEIKYKYFDSQDGPIISVSKKEVASIKIAGKDNQVMTFKDDPMAVSNKKILDKTKVIKTNPFSMLFSHVSLTAEWMQKPQFNWEVTAGLIGPGYKQNNIFGEITKLNGFYIKGGPKFLFGNTEDVEVEGVSYRLAHPLKGRYLKIEPFFSSFTRGVYRDYWNGYLVPNPGLDESLITRFTCYGFNIIYGRQFIIGNIITLNYYLGIGYGAETKNVLQYPKSFPANQYGFNADDFEFSPRRYSHSRFPGNFPLSWTSGISIGYIFKYWPWEKDRTYQRDLDPSRKSMGAN